jgi:hypothetical protein
MIIDNDLTVNVGDGVAIFDEPTLRDWAILLDMDKKSLEEQVDILLPKLKSVEGFKYRDGSDVSIEDIKAKKFSARFFLQLMIAWTKAVVSDLKGEGEAKKAETIN